jgi:hypothetical protein
MDAAGAACIPWGNRMKVQAIAARWVNIQRQPGWREHLEWSLT